MVKGPEQSSVLGLILVHPENELRLYLMVNGSFICVRKEYITIEFLCNCRLMYE
jgi:hypothetical protein